MQLDITFRCPVRTGRPPALPGPAARVGVVHVGVEVPQLTMVRQEQAIESTGGTRTKVFDLDTVTAQASPQVQVMALIARRPPA